MYRSNIVIRLIISGFLLRNLSYGRGIDVLTQGHFTAIRTKHPVELMFADGRVEVSGEAIAEGMMVGVPR